MNSKNINKMRIRYFVRLVLMLVTMTLSSACDGDDDTEANGNNMIVKIDANGNVSGGVRFVALDDKNFLIDDIKYTVEDGRLWVSGYDEYSTIENVNIISELHYLYNHYKVSGISGFRGCKTIKSVVLPDNVITLPDDVFRDCTSLKSAIIPKAHTYDGWGTFMNCTSLETVKIGEIDDIPQEFFYGCKSLKNIIIPNSVDHIGSRAFEGSTSLSSIIIPNSVESIADSAFRGCTNLSSITVQAIIPPEMDGNYPFENTNNCPIYVPSQSLEAYKSAKGWSRIADRIKAM